MFSINRTNYERILFGSLIFINLFVLFYFYYFPNWDGPAHVGSAAVAINYSDPSRLGFHKYFYISLIPSPNLVGHFILVLLERLLPPIMAEKILVLFIFVLFPLSFRYMILELNPHAVYMSYFALPFSIGWFIYAGQYNFNVGIIVFFVTVRYWLHNYKDIQLWQAIVLCCLLIVLYISHIVPFVMFYLFAFVLIVYRVVWEYLNNGNTLKDGFQSLMHFSLPVILASIPSMVMALIYFSQPNNEDLIIYRLSIMGLIKEFGTLSSVLLVFSRTEYLFSILVSLLTFALFWTILKKPARIWRQPFNGYVIIFLIILGLYFVLPDALAGGSFLSRRLSLFAYFALILWLSHFDFQPIARRTIVAILTIAMIGITLVRIPKLIEFNQDIAEFMSVGPYLDPNSTVLTLAYTYDGYYVPESEQNGVTAFAKNTRPMDFLSGYLMAEYDIVDLGNYEGAYQYFPVKYRHEVNPFIYLGDGPDWMEFLPPNVNISYYSEQTSGSVDYVLVWGIDVATDEFLFHPNTILIQQQLSENYKLIYISKPRGLLHVYTKN